MAVGGLNGMDNEQARYYQSRFSRWIKSSKWDSISEELLDTDIAIIAKVMNAEKDSNCSWMVWANCDYVLDRIGKISKRA